MSIPAWLRVAGGDVVLSLHVQPGAKTTELAGEYGDALKVRLRAPPVDGKANDCLLDFLAERLKVPRASIMLETGSASRRKRVRIAGIESTRVRENLA